MQGSKIFLCYVFLDKYFLWCIRDSFGYFGGQAAQSPAPAPKCSMKFIAENCQSIGIQRGKYCGVGYAGCKAEKPCDNLDACCKHRSKCVDKKGTDNMKCLTRVQKSSMVDFPSGVPIA